MSIWMTVCKSVVKVLHTHFTYMIHSVGKFLWEGIGKSCFYCLTETKHYTEEETQFETIFKFTKMC